jgi:diguanylate cyclase (GGDEF)-like protein
MDVLIVEDNDTVARGLSRSLTVLDKSIDVHAVADLASALVLLQSGRHIDVALVDLGLPDARGIQAPTELRAIREDLVIVVITGNPSSEMATHLVRLGIQDYIVKSEATPHRVLRSVRLALERHQRELELKRIASVDQLTGALNRRGLLSAVSDAFNAAKRLELSAALMTLDIDHFKTINDTFGHPVGDRIVQETCRRVGCCIRRNDALGRAGGDEFWVILKGSMGREHVPAVAGKILQQFTLPMQAGSGVDSQVDVGISIGVARVPGHAASVEAWGK